MSMDQPTVRPRRQRLRRRRPRAEATQGAGRRLPVPATPGAASAGTKGEPGADPRLGGRLIDFARVFDALPSPCLLLTPGLVICGANQAYLRATGRTLSDLYGRFMFDAFPDNPDDPTADGVANLRASLERALATRRPDTMAVQKYDIQVGTGAGARFEERYWSPVNVPVLDAGGRVELLIHRVEDVTDLVCQREARSGHPADREIATALQTALLPHAVPSVGSLEVATRYLAARPGLAVCGDWYDVADLGGGRMGVVVGDVVGHGLAAAAVMGQLRGAAAAALHGGCPPGTAMGVLERRARIVDGALGATAFIAVIDSAAGTLTYCNAGQVPPVLVRPDRTIVDLDGARSPVLCAVDDDVDHPEVTIGFEPGSLLLAFTDGLVERPGEHLDRGYERLRRAVEDPPADLDGCARAIVEASLDGHVRVDDIALVVVRHGAGPAPA